MVARRECLGPRPSIAAALARRRRHDRFRAQCTAAAPGTLAVSADAAVRVRARQRTQPDADSGAPRPRRGSGWRRRRRAAPESGGFLRSGARHASRSPQSRVPPRARRQARAADRSRQRDTGAHDGGSGRADAGCPPRRAARLLRAGRGDGAGADHIGTAQPRGTDAKRRARSVRVRRCAETRGAAGRAGTGAGR